MKRSLAFFAAIVLTLVAQVALAQPALRTISGNPLTINIGGDASFQVFTSLVPGTGQFYPDDNAQTADMGVFVRSGGALYAPDFTNHPGGTATDSIGARTVWTPVSISAVSGTGSSADPFTVTVVNDAATTGLRMTMTVTYVNGENFFRKSMAFTSSGGTQNFDVFLGGDIYLAGDDDGVPYNSSGAVGGQDCATPPTYTILFIPLTPANRFSARDYDTVWTEIGDGLLSNQVDSGCQDNGAALQWQNRTVVPGGGAVIQAATSFGAIPPIVTPPPSNAAAIPTMSEWALMLTAVLVAMLGLRRARSMRS